MEHNERKEALVPDTSSLQKESIAVNDEVPVSPLIEKRAPGLTDEQTAAFEEPLINDDNDETFFLEITPTASSTYTADDLRASIKLSDMVPSNETTEKKYLKKRFGFKDARGLFCYSSNSEYKDLYAYFDAADKISPVNFAATQAFHCYGLDGNQFSNDWDIIRGSVFVCRNEPDLTFYSKMHNFGTKLTKSQMIETLLYFVGKNAKKIALKRDSQRTMNSMKEHEGDRAMGGAAPSFYMSPAGFRTQAKMEKDSQICNYCKQCATTAKCPLKACANCKTTYYCNTICQKADWKAHKITCKS
jgi:hypothetical protein